MSSSKLVSTRRSAVLCLPLQ